MSWRDTFVSWRDPFRSYILIFPSLFFFQPFFSWVLLMFFQNPLFPPIENFYPPRAPSKKSCMESLPLFSLGLAYVFSIFPFSSLKKMFIPLGSQKTQHKSPKRTGRQRSHSRIFFFSWDRWDGWDGCDGWDGWMDGLMDGWMDGSSLWGIGFPYILINSSFLFEPRFIILFFFLTLFC